MFIDIDDPVTSNTASETSEGFDIVEVSGTPAQVVEDKLKFYFEAQSTSEDYDEVVKNIEIIRPGVAHIQFISPEGMLDYSEYTP